MTLYLNQSRQNHLSFYLIFLHLSCPSTEILYHFPLNVKFEVLQYTDSLKTCRLKNRCPNLKPKLDQHWNRLAFVSYSLFLSLVFSQLANQGLSPRHFVAFFLNGTRYFNYQIIESIQKIPEHLKYASVLTIPTC